MEDSLAPKMRYKVIGSRKPKRVSKGPWKAGSENGRGSPRKANEPRMPKREMGHIKSLGGKQTASPKRPSRIKSNNITAGIVEWYGRRC